MFLFLHKYDVRLCGLIILSIFSSASYFLWLHTPFFSTNQIQGGGHTDLSQYKKENNNTHIARHQIHNFLLSRKVL